MAFIALNGFRQVEQKFRRDRVRKPSSSPEIALRSKLPAQRQTSRPPLSSAGTSHQDQVLKGPSEHCLDRHGAAHSALAVRFGIPAIPPLLSSQVSADMRIAV